MISLVYRYGELPPKTRPAAICGGVRRPSKRKTVKSDYKKQYRKNGARSQDYAIHKVLLQATFRNKHSSDPRRIVRTEAGAEIHTCSKVR